MTKQPTQDNATQADDKSTTTSTAKADDAEGESKFTAADVAKAIKASVRVQKKGKDGKIEVVERNATADDILSFLIDGADVIAVTIDGRKYRAEIG